MVINRGGIFKGASETLSIFFSCFFGYLKILLFSVNSTLVTA